MIGLTLGLVSTVLAFGPLPESTMLPPGQPAPGWTNLIGTDGNRHALVDLKDKAAVVLVFFSVNCPDSLAYEDRLLGLAKDYAAKSVAVVFLNVSLWPEDNLAAMTAHAKKTKGFSVPFLFDPTQALGLSYAARATPTVFVLDQGRRIAYRGAFDDSELPDQVDKHYVRDALDAVLAGRPVTHPETEAIGCTLEYEATSPE
ncbi:MAG: thioredoxin family protein [Isosphaeraceae bacterium]